MTMKKLIPCLTMILLFAAPVFAQTPASADQKGKMQEMMRQRLKDSVQLSDVMVDSVMAIRSEYQPQFKEIFMNQQLSEQEKTAKFNDIKSLMKTRYQKIGLTDEQISKIEEMDQRMRDRMKNKMKNGGNK
jgi:ribonuclease D